jgi:DNA-binding NarL/FixJ family response regulator
MNQGLKVVIADDHPLFRKGLRQSIEDDPSMTIVGEAGDGETALRMIEERGADVAVLDIDMPRMSGLRIAELVQQRNLFVALVILTMYKQEDMFNEAMDAGVRGYVLKETAAIDILEAMKTVAGGRYYISPSLSHNLVLRNQRAKDLLERTPTLRDLTPSERRVLAMIARQKTSKEIADELNISYRTVDTHRTNIATKLNLHGANSVLRFALENRDSLPG